jgi:hypothetical protein
VQLVRGERQQVNAIVYDVERYLARTLRGIDVQQHPARPAKAPERVHVLHDSDLVVHMHQRHEHRVRP